MINIDTVFHKDINLTNSYSVYSVVSLTW